MKNNSKQFKTIQNFLAVILLLTISSVGFYACKKNVAEVPDPNSKYKGELKTYHESQDYKNLLSQYPNATFVDQPIFDANSKMKTIVTNIISNSGEVIKAMTYFEPQKGFNTWYPTIIMHLTAESGKNIKSMLDEKVFSGKFEVTTSNNSRIKLIDIVKNESVYEDKFIFISDGNIGRSLGSQSSSKIMYIEQAGGGLKECLKAADICATNEMKNMGYFALALCIVEAYICVPVLYADCFLSEKACLGVNKPLNY